MDEDRKDVELADPVTRVRVIVDLGMGRTASVVVLGTGLFEDPEPCAATMRKLLNRAMA